LISVWKTQGSAQSAAKKALNPQFNDDEDAFEIDMTGVSLGSPTTTAALAMEDKEEAEIEEAAQTAPAAKDVEWSLDLDSEEEVDLSLSQFHLGETQESSAPVDLSFDDEDL
jgi:hypothetical protein